MRVNYTVVGLLRVSRVFCRFLQGCGMPDTTPHLEQLGERVRAWRLKLYDSQDEAAAAGGTSVPSWRKIEKGRTDVSERTYAAVDKAFKWQGGRTNRAATQQEDLPAWPDADIATEAHATDFRSGRQDAAWALLDDHTTPRIHEGLASEAERHLKRIRKDHVDGAAETLARVGADVERGGMADLILRIGDQEYVVEVKSSRPLDDDEIVRDVGRAAELQAAGKQLLVYAYVDWPAAAVARVERMGGRYATPATVGEVIETTAPSE